MHKIIRAQNTIVRKHKNETIRRFSLNITDIRIRRTYQDMRLKALVSITVDGDLAVHDIKVIEGPERLFVAMPSRKDENGVFRDIVHPITPEARQVIEQKILTAYQEHLDKLLAETESRDDDMPGESEKE